MPAIHRILLLRIFLLIGNLGLTSQITQKATVNNSPIVPGVLVSRTRGDRLWEHE